MNFARLLVIKSDFDLGRLIHRNIESSFHLSVLELWDRARWVPSTLMNTKVSIPALAADLDLEMIGG
jgi:hypothetical protein